MAKIDSDAVVCRIVDDMIADIQSTGLHYQAVSFETTIEGENVDALMDIAKECMNVDQKNRKYENMSGTLGAPPCVAIEKEMLNMMKTALSIAGSDCSGGAGIQADLKTMTMNGVYGMSAITALTAQNTTGVSAIMEVTPEFLQQQIDIIFEDIRPDAVKIGMVPSEPLMETIAERLTFWKATNIVVDPVMVATSGADLMHSAAIKTLKEELLPLAALATPNIPEAEVLTGMNIHSKDDMIAAATAIQQTCGCAVLLKGGHSIHDADDLLCTEDGVTWFLGRRINNPNTHGTGCTLSSAIASNLAKGFNLPTSIQMAKDYISGALAAMLDFGKGSGPMNHAFLLR